MYSGHDFFSQPRENEIRVIEHSGRRWLQQYRVPPKGHRSQRAWVDVAELSWPRSNIRLIRSQP